MVAPKPHTAGIKAYPSARFVESVSSPMMLFITPKQLLRGSMRRVAQYTPAFPLSTPVRHRLEIVKTARAF